MIVNTALDRTEHSEPAAGRPLLIPVLHTVQVTSFGGSGTKMLRDWLQEQGAALPSEHDSGIWKHLPAPPTKDRYQIPEGYKVLYLISDPVESLLSVFRRGYHMWHAVRMASQARWPEGFLLEDHPTRPNWGIKEFLSVRSDCFGIHDHFRNWTTSHSAERGYPIMVLKYETMWEHLEEMGAFLGLRTSQVGRFPERRERTKRDKELEAARPMLEAIYGDLAGEIREFPGLQVI